MKTTRKAAIDAIEPFYKTGKPCLNGHYSKRFTISGGCYQCHIENPRKLRKEFNEKLAAKKMAG